MGQQQLLLIVLVTIVIGIAVIGAITLFQDNAVSQNRDAVMTDLANLVTRAQQYYRRPRILGGGERQFTGLTADDNGLFKLTAKKTNDNGTYSIAVAGGATSVALKGVGTERSSDGSLIESNMTVLTDSTYVTEIH